MMNTAMVRRAFAGSILLGCSVVPSRAPLGGIYALPDSAPGADRRAQAEPADSAPSDVGVEEPVTPVASASGALAPLDANARAVVAQADTIVFEPLRVGARIKAEMTVSTSAEMHGGPPGLRDDGKLSLDGNLRVEINVLKASAQSLDELDLTLTTLAMHSQFAGQGSDSKPEPPQTYNVMLSGSSPSIRAHGGSKVDPIERVKLALLLVPLVEFCAHWSQSPTLELKPGWTSKVQLPFAATLFATRPNESMRVGPLSARFSSRARASSGDVPIEFSLPIAYGSDLGKIDFDLTGTARLNEKTGRPTAFELNGPLSASGGVRGAQLNIVGRARFAVTLAYD